MDTSDSNFKVLYMTKSSGVLRTFIYTDVDDDKQNKRITFVDDNSGKVLTIYTDDISYILTSPYNEY